METLKKRVKKFKILNFGKYNETTNPQDHISNYRSAMRLQKAYDEIMCLHLEERRQKFKILNFRKFIETANP